MTDGTQRPAEDPTQVITPAADPVSTNTFANEVNKQLAAADPTEPAKEPAKEPVATVDPGDSKLKEIEERLKAREAADKANNEVIEAIKKVGNSVPAERTEIQKLSDKMFSDSEGFTEGVVKLAEDRLRKENEKREGNKNWWDSFYDNNKDLSAHKDVVQMISAAEMPNLQSMSPDEAGKIVAEKSRAVLDNVAKRYGVKREVMQKADTTVMTSSPSSAPAQAVVDKPTTFVDEINNYQGAR